ncbi:MULTISPECIES: PIG-L family deacetylase [unclassified Streptomyces]|uniref:PIG-L family deacetylase n=1 Tax=unclassified Streptomyces TaxID=2593676 RepID=UPI0016603F97|nr:MULTISPECIES: PIG-L family deacetylase [unclassified Streptomyces]MBD0710024.1 PIG-L family deacetylase [Streptomyces sp. CBMA291]MBD0715685.1 PIG-L family deacetylase [Streptomyces sp. CBMA370]
MTSAPRRRTLLAAALAVLPVAAGCSVPEPRRTAPTADPAPGRPIASARARRALLMQFSAHPDDDLYFMNPDSRRLLDAGVPLVSVYVTAGEHTGRNRIAGMPETPPDRAAYSSARHQGLRQSYAAALGLPLFTPWRREALALPGGRKAEVDVLAHGARRVELVFLDLPMHTARRYMALPALWHDRALELPTHRSAGSPVTRSAGYDYDGLVAVLAWLLGRYRPTVVHTLDPDPDVQHSDDATRGRDSEQPGYSDHGDHTATACFTWAALIRWVTEAVEGGGPVPAFTVTAFRGYYNRHWPKNLPPRTLREKAARLVPYGGDPSWACGNPSGCGDYGVGGDRPLTNRKGWVRSTHHRWPGAGPVPLTGPDGRLTAYGVLGLRAVRWRESAPGVWEEPEDLGGGPLAPALGSAVTADGRLLLFGVRFAALDGHGGPNRRELVLLEQRSPGGPFLAWRGLGNPEREDDRGRRVGAPVAVLAPDGRVHLFVRNADREVATRVRAADGGWGPWRVLPGKGPVQDGLAVSVDGPGRVHVYAAGAEAVRHWVDGAAAPGRLPLSGSAVASAGGALYYRPPASAALLGPEGDAGLDGFGEVVAARAAGPGTVLLGTGEDGRVRLRTGDRLRSRTGTPSAAVPALHLDGRGATVVALGPDAQPWSWRPS